MIFIGCQLIAIGLLLIAICGPWFSAPQIRGIGIGFLIAWVPLIVARWVFR